MRSIFILALLCPFLSNCQPITIKGKIINELMEPIPSATILHQRTNTATTANEKGEFTLPNLLLNDTLIISAIGYATEIEVQDYVPHGTITFMLKRKTGRLQEVVISTGYQSLPRETATGSFTFLSNDLLNQQVGSNIMERLASVANGYAVVPPVAGPPDIMIRGFSTISGPKAPLIVVDNFPYEGNISNINPNDVENITILKDAAAASIWGAKAGNGVIVITTKKGRFSQKLKIEASANVLVAEKPNLLSIPAISTSDFIDVEQFLFSKQYRFSDTAATDRPPFSQVYEILFKQRSGQIAATEAQAQINSLRNYDVRRQYESYMYRKSVNRQYAINLRGGSEIFAWLASAGIDNNLNSLSARYNRLNLHFQNSFKPSKKLEFTASLYFTGTSSTEGKSPYGSIHFMKGGLTPYTLLADDEGNPLPLYYDKRQTYVDTAGAGKLLNWNYYPLTDDQYVHNTTTVRDISATAGVKYKFSPSLFLDVKYYYEQQHSVNRTRYQQQSYYARNIINMFTQLNRTNGTVAYKLPLGDILDLAYANLAASGLRSQLNYNYIRNKNELVAIAGSEIKQLANQSNNYRTYGYNDDILTFTPVDFANTYPQFTNNRQAFIPNPADFSSTLNRFVSFYTNAAYTYNSRYAVSASARKDASNLFGVNTNNKWTPLWSAGLSWLLSNESFYKFKPLSYLKFRLTYGFRGNVDPSMSAVTTITYSTNSPYTQTPTARVANFYNPDLRWEKIGMLNAGMDFKLAGNRLWGSVEYFTKHATDLYGVVPVDVTLGLNTYQVTKNVASLSGRGWDVSLNSLNTTGALAWSTNLELNNYKDEVTRFYNANLSGSSFIGGGSKALQGFPLFATFAYKWGGLDPATGDPLGYLDGQPGKNYTSITGTGTKVSDLVYIGSSLPTLYGSLGNTFNWKSFSVAVRLSCEFNYYFIRRSIDYSSLFSRAVGHPDYALRWQAPGDEKFTSVPSMVYPAIADRDAFYSYAEILAAKADNIRLQYINLSWNIAKTKAPKLPFTSLRIYAVANNLGIIWRANKFGLDPDYANSIPPQKTVALGLMLTL